MTKEKTKNLCVLCKLCVKQKAKILRGVLKVANVEKIK